MSYTCGLFALYSHVLSDEEKEVLRRSLPAEIGLPDGELLTIKIMLLESCRLSLTGLLVHTPPHP
jgi:hypothetical protein